MRFTISYKYNNYPLSEELTAKSKRIGLLTSPLYGVVAGGLLGVLLMVIIVYLFPSAEVVPFFAMLGGFVAGPLLLASYRNKKFAQFDAEYDQLLKSMQK